MKTISHRLLSIVVSLAVLLPFTPIDTTTDAMAFKTINNSSALILWHIEINRRFCMKERQKSLFASNGKA